MKFTNALLDDVGHFGGVVTVHHIDLYCVIKVTQLIGKLELTQSPCPSASGSSGSDMIPFVIGESAIVARCLLDNGSGRVAQAFLRKILILYQAGHFVR